MQPKTTVSGLSFLGRVVKGSTILAISLSKTLPVVSLFSATLARSALPTFITLQSLAKS